MTQRTGDRRERTWLAEATGKGPTGSSSSRETGEVKSANGARDRWLSRKRLSTQGRAAESGPTKRGLRAAIDGV